MLCFRSEMSHIALFLDTWPSAVLGYVVEPLGVEPY